MLVNIDTPIIKVFPQVNILEGPHVGLELEYEGVDIADMFSTEWEWARWRNEEDPSLRQGGVEWISRPTKPNMLRAALTQLDDLIARFDPVVSVRCGLHAHINMSDRTMGDIFRVGTLYGLLEPYIFSAFAPGREDNHFCVPLWYNTAMQGYMYRDNMKLRRGMVMKGMPVPKAEPDPGFLAHGGLSDIHQALVSQALGEDPSDVFEFLHDSKYSGFNLRALSKFGTIEYRLPKSTTDVAAVERFARFLLDLHEYAQSFDDPVDILTTWEDIGYEGLVDTLGMPFTPCENEDLEDALDSALLVAGHEPLTHDDLEWEIA